MRRICLGRFEFGDDDGVCMAEFRSEVGVLTMAFDPGASRRFRLYGPDGLEVDPRTVARVPGWGWEYSAYDLTQFLRV